MTADEARLKSFTKHKLKNYIKEIEEAIEEGFNSIKIGKDTLAKEALIKLGYKVETIYNNDYEMRTEGYKISW